MNGPANHFPQAFVEPSGLNGEQTTTSLTQLDTAGLTTTTQWSSDAPTLTPSELLFSPDWRWSKPVNLGPDVNSPGPEQQFSLSADEKALVFVRGGDLLISQRTDINQRFKSITTLDGVNRGDSWDGAPGLARDGLTLFFESDRLRGSFYTRMQDIWVAPRDGIDTIFDHVECLTRPVNSTAHDSNPSVSYDGLTLIFVSDRVGEFAIYESTRESLAEPFGEPQRLNLDGAQPCLSADGLTILYQSAEPGGRGGNDLWMTRRATRGDPFGASVNLGGVVNTSGDELDPHLTPDGSRVYFSSSRPGGSGDSDLWYSDRIPVVPLRDD